jgi:hypothetical protein
MELFIYTERPADDVKPGDLIDHPKGPMVVDETRANIVGVDIYGRTPGVDGGPRRRLHLTFQDTADVLPGAGDLFSIWSMITYAIQHYRGPAAAGTQVTELDQLAPQPEDVESESLRAWLGGGAAGQLVVRVGKEVWYVEPQYSGAPSANPDDEASEDT